MTEPDRKEELSHLPQTIHFLLYKEDDTVLLEERSRRGSAFFGKTVIPSGHIDEVDFQEGGDPCLNALKRELSEEFGVVPLMYYHLLTEVTTNSRGKSYLAHVYLVTEYEGEPQTEEPQKGRHKWVFIERAEDELQTPITKRAIAEAKRTLGLF